MDELGGPLLPGVDVPGKEYLLPDLLEMSDSQVRSLKDVKIPIFRTSELKIIPYPDNQGTLYPVEEFVTLVICANDYLAGDMVALDGERIVSEKGDCYPTGEYGYRAVTGDELLAWLKAYGNRNTGGSESIMDQVGSGAAGQAVADDGSCERVWVPDGNCVASSIVCVDDLTEADRAARAECGF